MVTKKRNRSPIVLVAVILFIIYIIVGSFQTFFSETTLGRVLQVSAVLSSAFLIMFKFLAWQIPEVQKITDHGLHRIRPLLSKAGIQNIADDNTPVGQDINPEQLRKIKYKLLAGVTKACKQITENIEKSSIIISDSYKIPQEKIFYANFSCFGSEKTPGNIVDSYTKDTFECTCIIGSPGNGKTYYLVNKLLEKITHINKVKDAGDYVGKIPVYVSLSSWNYHISLEQYLHEALSSLYNNLLNKHDIKILLDKKELFIFADGLDEVPFNNRPQCFDAIIAFAKSNDITFCCRKEEFCALINEGDKGSVEHISIHELLPLSLERTKDAIKNSKLNYPEIIQFITSRAKLCEFIKFPLRLNLFLKVYDNFPNNLKQRISNNEISEDKIEQILWEQYDKQIFYDKYLSTKKESTYTQKAFRTYIVWLANRMYGTSFFIEEIQPSWLHGSVPTTFYYVASRLLSCAVVSLGIGFFLAEPFTFYNNCIFSSLVIVIFTLAFNKLNNKVFTSAWLMVLIFSGLLIFITAIYQGFAVPRATSEMSGAFSISESYAGLLVGLFLGVIFGYRKSNQSTGTDISPMQQPNDKYYFSLKSALKTGLFGGIGIGVFLGVAAYFVHTTFHGNLFNKWLESNVEKFMSFLSFLDFMEKTVLLKCKIISFGFIEGFFIGFLVFSVLGGRQKKVGYKEHTGSDLADSQKESYVLNAGIKKSLQFSIFYGFSVSLIVTIVYGIFIYILTGKADSLYKAINIGIGSGIIALLWFGGFEFIQHWILRLYLYLYGIAPIRYGNWLRKAEDLALIRRVGASFQFYHPNLKKYYQSIQLNGSQDKILNLKRHRQLYILNTFLILLLLLSIVYPFAERFLFRSFWQRSNQLEMVSDSPLIQKINDTSIVTTKRKHLIIKAIGKIKLGTFTGKADARGTETALLGFPISNTYNIHPQFKQGTLVIWSATSKTWTPVDSLDMKIRRDTIISCVVTGLKDTIKFQVNDLEWQNNKGNLKLILSLTDSCVYETK